jgi:uncharacterized repeat protein (TIGR03803 family)
MRPTPKWLSIAAILAVTACAQSGVPGGAFNPAVSPQVHKELTTSGNPALYIFQGQPDAFQPVTGLADIGSTLYGTTYGGGANNLGAVYSVTTSGTEKILHSFGSDSQDGIYPDGPLTAVGNTLYGTTYQGGTEHGILFSITPAGKYTILWNFDAGSDKCAEPDAALTYVPSKKALFGVTYAGGANGEGCIFKVSLGSKKTKVSLVYSFTGASDSSTAASAVVFYKNALYGTTPEGGVDGAGSVFKVTLAGKESLIYSFKNEPDGDHPQAPLVVDGTALYGTTSGGGLHECGDYAGCGTIFKVTPAGKETVLYSFSDVASKQDGQAPAAALIDVNGTLYGTAHQSTYGYGVIFSITPAKKNSYGVVYNFNPKASAPNFPESPWSPVIAVNGSLYGTTSGDSSDCVEGGDYGCGSVFGIAP